MADTAYGVNSNEAVKLWSAKLAREALKKTYIKRFMGKSSDSMIMQKDELSKNPGDRIRITLRHQLRGRGTIGDANLEGNEESLTTFTNDLIINQLRHAVRTEGKMTEQRIPFSIREEAMMGLSDWWAERWDIWAFNHLAGYTPGNVETEADVDTDASGPEYNGHNTITAATRIIRADGAVAGTPAADDTALGAATVFGKFSLKLIDKAIENAKVGQTGLGRPPIRPIMVDGKKWFVVFLHPYQVTDLRVNALDPATAGLPTAYPVLWYDTQRALVEGGAGRDSPIFNGALGEYNGCVLHETTHIPEGVAVAGTPVTTVRRAVLCGAQAAVCGFGQGHDKSSYDWFEQLFDYGNKLGVKAGCIAGLKKSTYNSNDFGTVVMASYAVPHL